uniref:hypothetical protein n=1 Tax=Nonomuraea sp. CA-251285 TaxID=3240002 RepID=UPI003F4971DA
MNDRRSPGHLTESDSLFLFGTPDGVIKSLDSSRATAAMWKRVVQDSGVAQELMDAWGLSVDRWPDNRVVPQVFPEQARVGTVTIGMDVAAAVAKSFEAARGDDERYEKATGRWVTTPDRVRDYVPGDAGSIRWSLLPSWLTNTPDWDRLSADEVNMRILRTVGGAWAYMAAPHFVPADLALDVVTGDPPEPSALDEVRLPGRYVMLFHDGMPVPVIAGTDAEIDTFASNMIVTDETLVIGGILAADDEHRPLSYGFIIVAYRGPDGLYNWWPVSVPVGAHGAGRILYGYAALLSWAGWTVPPKTPKLRRTMGRRDRIRAIARTPEGEQGAFLGVRVLDYQPPTAQQLADDPLPRERAESGRQLQYRTKRRAHWTKRTRLGIRDENKKLVGRVYGPDAVEGETFIRGRVWVRGAEVREDLPERPGSTVYRLPADAERQG